LPDASTPSDAASPNRRFADPLPGAKLAAGVIRRSGDELVIYHLVYSLLCPVDYPQLHNIAVDW